MWSIQHWEQTGRGPHRSRTPSAALGPHLCPSPHSTDHSMMPTWMRPPPSIRGTRIRHMCTQTYMIIHIKPPFTTYTLIHLGLPHMHKYKDTHEYYLNLVHNTLMTIPYNTYPTAERVFPSFTHMARDIPRSHLH